MQHHWRAALVGALALCAIAVTALVAASPVALATADELETRTISTYDVNADGGIHVTLAARVTNRDPSTQRRTSGRVLFYSATAFAVHDAATNLTARSGSVRLTTETFSGARDSNDPFRLVAVRFNRDLYYNEEIAITLEYDISAVRTAQLLVNRQYAFVPAVGQGSFSLVRITAPADRQLTIGSANCARVADNPTTYTCGTSTTAADYRPGGPCAIAAAEPRWDCAFTGRDFVVIPFEATAADLSLATRSSRTTLARRSVQITVSYFSGDEAWAARVEEIIRRGLPILEEANGFPYPGPATIEIVESGYRDTHGYEGLASSQGRIRLTPVVEDQTVLHEVSHLWSGIFASRWLAEGMADFTANAAARRLDLRPQVVMQPLPPAPTLEEWGALRSQIAVSRTERDTEESGYARSLRFIEILAERAGAAMLASVNATLAQERTRATARGYLDLLEESTGGSYASLFAEWALTSADAQLLPARQAARSDAKALLQRAAPAGLTLPTDIADALRAWDFDRAQRLIGAANTALEIHLDSLARAQAAGYSLGDGFARTLAGNAEGAIAVARAEAGALDAVRDAADRANDPRSPVMRVGLLGRDLSGGVESARDALARGDYESATSTAASVQRQVDHAGRDGAVGLAIGAGLLLAGLAFVLGRGRARRRSA